MIHINGITYSEKKNARPIKTIERYKSNKSALRKQVYPYLSTATKQSMDKRHQRIYTVASDWTKREYPQSGVSLKHQVENCWRLSSYVVPEPDLERFENEMNQYNDALQNPRKGFKIPSPPVLHYINGPVINMNAWQRQMQREGKLPGCIANCGVPPIGSVSPMLTKIGRLWNAISRCR